MISVAELITDPDFAQSFTVQRNSGSYVDGLFVATPSNISLTGVILPLKTKELETLPQGDAAMGGIKTYTLTELYPTGAGRISDVVLWQNQSWKIWSVSQYSDFGYFLSICTRLSGQ